MYKRANQQASVRYYSEDQNADDYWRDRNVRRRESWAGFGAAAMAVRFVVAVHLASMTGGKSGVVETRYGVRRTEGGAWEQTEKTKGGDSGVLRGDCTLNVGADWKRRVGGHCTRSGKNGGDVGNEKEIMNNAWTEREIEHHSKLGDQRKGIKAGWRSCDDREAGLGLEW